MEMVQMTNYHPASLVDIAKTEHIRDHLTYHIDYFQQTGLVKNDLVPLHKSITPSKETMTILQERLEAKEENLMLLHPATLVKFLKADLKSSMIHGMGMGHVRETAITIHPVYGIPYIPSSSVKGLVRNWAIQAFFNGKIVEDVEKLTERELRIHQLMNDLFGTKDSGGLARFYDIFIPDFEIKPDILTVHFPDYYNKKGGISPNDFNDKGDNSPNPVAFYSVASNSKITISFGVLNSKRIQRQTDYPTEELVELLSSWVQSALKELGIGAKTAVGYGRFTEFEDITEEKLAGLKERRKREKVLAEQRKQAELEAQREREKQEMLENMTEEEKLIYEIEQFDPANQQDVERSKDKLQFFDNFVELNSREAALKLKEFWTQSGDWKVKPKKKQYEKVQAVKTIIKE